jgi:multidrug efflux pump subunit AcrA (membrane-fusion protein)
MKHKRPPLPVMIFLALTLLAGGYFGIRALLNPATTVLTASGTIEAIEVTISPEIGGKVTEVNVDEGAQVKTGDLLFQLDDTLIQGQRAVAAASLEFAKAAASTANAALFSAQANYDLALNAARLESSTTRTLDWAGENPAGYTLPGGYFSRADEIAAARAEVEAAACAYQAAQNDLQILLIRPMLILPSPRDNWPMDALLSSLPRMFFSAPMRPPTPACARLPRLLSLR